jgi:hypothetical protein
MTMSTASVIEPLTTTCTDVMTNRKEPPPVNVTVCPPVMVNTPKFPGY